MDDITALRNHYEVDPPSGDTMQRERARLDDLIATTTPGHLTKCDATNGVPLRKRRRWMIAAAVPAVALLAAAGWAIVPRDATTAASLTCGIGGDFYGFRNDGTLPTDACAQVWVDIGAAPDLASVPPLTTCVFGEEERASVIAYEDTGPETCSDVGYVPWTGQGSFLDAGRALNNALVELGVDDPSPPTPDPCIDEAKWQDQLRRSFDAEGLTDWTIEVSYNDENPSCFLVMDLNPTDKTISLAQSQG